MQHFARAKNEQRNTLYYKIILYSLYIYIVKEQTKKSISKNNNISVLFKYFFLVWSFFQEFFIK